MNKEEQYRYGLFPQADPIPQWVKDRVAEVAHDHAPRCADIIAEAEELIRKMHDNALAKQRALELLDWRDDRGNDGLLRHTEQLVKANPANEADIWCAMWTVRHAHEDELHFEQLLPQYADALEAQQQQKESGWPTDWQTAYNSIWTEAGGNPASARAWARAGWRPADVLLLQRLPLDGRNLQLRERVTALRVPLRDDEQFPPIRIPQQVRNFSPSSSRGTE